MTRASLAEQILSLVLPPLRAEAVAGDLNETTQTAVTFWISVIKIVLRATIQQFSSSPSILLWSSLQTLRFTLASTLLFALVAVPFAFTNPQPIPWIAIVYSALMPIQVGRLVARRAPRREILSWIAALLFTCIGWSITLAIKPVDFNAPALFGIIPHPILLLPMLLGTILERRKQLRLGIASV